MSKRVVCEWCGHSKSIAKDVDKAYAKGRADAIDELRPFIHKNYKGQKFIFVCAEDFKNLDLQNS